MNRLPIVLGLSLWATAAFAWLPHGTGVPGPQNPLTYSAITTTGLETGAAPTLGAAGTTTTDPDFGTSVMRVTDASSCGGSAGGSSTVGWSPNEGTGWSRTINSNDTAVLFVSGGSAWYVQGVNVTGSTMALVGSCIRVPLAATALNFSATNPQLVYGLSSDGQHFDTFNWVTSTTTHVFDIATIPGFTPISLYLAQCDGSDTWCATSNNAQNLGTQIAFYNLQTSQTAVVDIANQTFQSGAGAPVALSMTNFTAAELANCGVHSLSPGHDGGWWEVVLDSCSNADPPSGPSAPAIFIQTNVNNITAVADHNNSEGHSAMGNISVRVNHPGGCSPYNYFTQIEWYMASPGGNPGNWVGVNQCNTIWTHQNGYEEHLSWLNDAEDSYSNQYPTLVYFPPYSASPDLSFVYKGELDIIQMAAANSTLVGGGPYDIYPATAPLVWRIAHGYSSTAASYCAALEYESPNISSDGKYALFPSDWLGGTGTGTCGGSHRSDVFMVALPL